MPETEMKNRQEMANFMLNEDAHDTSDYDGMTLLPGACTAAARPLFSLFAAHNSIIKDVHISENSSQKRAEIEVMPCAMGLDKIIDYIYHRKTLRWVLIRELIIFPLVMPCAMGFDKGIDYISHSNALRLVLIRELIIFIIVMP